METMSSNIRVSKISDINKIRKELWESIYSNFDNLNDLSSCIYKTFGKDVIDNIDFNFNELSINFNLLRPISNVELNATMTVAYSKFIDNLYYKNKIDDNKYRICSSRPDMLFIITLNTEQSATIKL